MPHADLIRVIQNETTPTDSTLKDAARSPNGGDEGAAVPSPAIMSEPSERRRGRIYAAMDHLRRFFQAPVLQQTEALSHRVDMIAVHLQHLDAELSILTRKIDALVIRSQRRS